MTHRSTTPTPDAAKRSATVASERGDVSIIIALVMLSIMVSSAILLSTILSRQIRLARDVVVVERALYAADTGLEEALYGLSRQIKKSVAPDGVVEYGGVEGEATYEGTATVIDRTGTLCASIVGTYRGESRRLASGPADCDAE